ncbi:MAG: large conductance mechanosensitive channel protein MscL [Dermatophilaceae bacterium]|jgi:large conductance mechanosensitive channel|nr:large conductance mechanosensitive channel protein MscL [Actinomycetales bacterium]MBP8880607.1 large conductance mechanosensitive channel protein MscL [Dermatophilaceae bacterium]MBP9918557.1 large conductance mechanosensitive channel protein MscL [Dermatophilaceae bacterium]
MIKGFKDFLMRGNVVDLAVAVVIATAFGKVIDAFVTVIMDIVGKLGGQPNFSGWVPGGIHVGDLLTTLISFLIIAAAVYFIVVVPLNKLAEARAKGIEAPTDAPSEEVALLTEIRDSLRARG